MGRLKSWESIVAAMLVAAFWILVLAVPDSGDAWPTWLRIIVGLVAAIAVLFGSGGVMWCIFNDRRARIWMFAIVALLGIVVGIVALIAGSRLDPASVPVVILLIGTATWPDAAELIEQDVRTEIFKWMGIVLAVSGLGEAAAQVGRQRTQARLGPDADVRGGGDLARGDD